MWTIVLIALLAAAALYFGLRLAALRWQLRDMGRQLETLLRLDSNALIRLDVPDKSLDRAADAFNRSLQELRQWRIRLERGDRGFNDALVMWAHDLRTPLTAVRGYSELLSEEPQTEAAGRYISTLSRRLRDVEDITEELFAFALLRADREALRPERLDLREQTENVAASFYDAYLNAGIEVTFDLDHPAYVMADSVALRRILYNLLSNALKHGSRRLHVRVSGDGSLEFTAGGAAFDPLAFERLFGRYFSVSSARGSQGVGLAVVRSLTEKLGGSFSGQASQTELEVRLQFPAADPPS